MLCHTCDPFLTDLISEDFVNWRHVEPGWYTYKHGNYAAVKAGAETGCSLCTLFNRVRTKKISGYEDLNAKWHVQASSVDYKVEYDKEQTRRNGTEQQVESRAKWSFYLLTVLPEMSWIAFEVFNPTLPFDYIGEELARAKFPYALSTSADTETARFTASRWLTECLSSHSHCSRQLPTALPTRVLDIRPSGAGFDLRLQTSEGHQGQYVTLSHCWGSRGRLKLARSNLAVFQQSIPFDQLPPTFSDAIRLTAALGQRYLWIDALCILQDDEEDWRREAASMCSVFENALFSISALAAEDSYSGLLQKRETEHTVINVSGASVGVRERLPSLDEALQASRLETRAWCLQERLLSPRILHIAPGQLHWECRTSISSETMPEESLRNDSGEASRPFTATSLKPVALERKDDDHHAHWLSLVAGYSSRHLTKPSDRLPAISGLADKARKELGLGTYMHGLWLENLHAGLLWRRKLEKRHGATKKVETLPTGPSWSWASSAGRVEYPLIDNGLGRQPSKADMVVKRRHADDTRGTSNTDTSCLFILGLIKRGSCKPKTGPWMSNQATFRASGSLLVDDGLPCTLDDADEPMSRGCYCLFVSIFAKATESRSRPKSEQQSCYLILERTQIDDAESRREDVFGSFRRIGMGFDTAQKVNKVFARAERRRVEMV